MEEIEWTRGWINREPEGDILLIGNYVHLFPFVVGESKLLDLITPVDLIAIITCHSIMSLFNKPFMTDELALDRYPPSPKTFFLLRALRKLLGLPVIQVLFKNGFQAMIPLLKSRRRFN